MPPGPKALLQGKRYLDAGKYPEAIEKLTDAVELLKENPQAWNHLGLAYQYAGQANKSAQAYQQALRLDRNLAVVRFNLGSLYLEQNSLPAAIGELTTYTVLQPKSMDGWLKLATAELRYASQASGNDRLRLLEAARRDFENVLKFGPNAEAYNGLGLIYVQRNRAREALPYFLAALKKQPQYAPALLNLAVVYQQYLNDKRLAVQRYREYLSQPPRPANAAQIEAIIRQLDADLNPVAVVPPVVTTNVTRPVLTTNPAVVAVSNVVRTNPVAEVKTNPAPVTRPPPPKTSMLPAQVQRETVVVKPAVTNVPEVVSTPVAEPVQPKPSPPVVAPVEATNPPSKAVVAANKVETAAEKPKFYQKLNPVNWFGKKEKEPVATPQATNIPTPTPPAKIVTLASTNPGTPAGVTPLPPKAAQSRYTYSAPEKLTTGNRQSALNFYNQGVKARNEGKSAPAIAFLQQAISADASFFEAYHFLGLTMLEAGDYKASAAAYEKALQLQPDSAPTRFNFALVLQRANFAQDAANELEKTLIKTPDDVRAHLLLGNIYAQKLFQIPKAREHYKKVLELEPRHPEATTIRYWLSAAP